ncbi:MAG: M4 family metallopeptidase [Chitinophagaceae bacterium]
MTSCVFTGIGTLATAQSANDIYAVERNSIDHSIKSMRFTETANIGADKADALFNTYLGINGKENVMVLQHTTHANTGLNTMRFIQYYKGIKVAHGGSTLTVKNNLVQFFTGNYYPFSDNPAPSASLKERAAFEKAVDFVGATSYKWQIPEEEAFIKKISGNPDTSFMPEGKLVWIEDMRDDKEDRKVKLAYSFDIYAEQPLSRQQVYVDANTGKILFSNAILKHTSATGASRYSGTVSFKTAKPASTYILFDSTRGDGVYTLNMNYGTSYSSAINFSSVSNTWPTAPSHNIALDVQWGTEMVYDYWLSQHGRHSWDDLDGVLQSYVHFSSGYNNAFWNGAYMTYGDGTGSSSGGFDPLVSLDVTGHEIGHGVCEATCNLVYEKEAGAMNEGLSDCWGATIEHYADPHETDAQPKKTWYIGEEIGAGTPLRRMDFPKLRADPDTYGGTYWYNVSGCTPTSTNDYCGVHNNSGVMNKFYFLLTDGGSGTNDKGSVYSVAGLGWTKAPAILYQTELVLSSTATYMDCRTASINIATLLYGSCSPEVKSVTDAWYAVGVGTAYVSCLTTVGFEVASMEVNELATATSCPASTVYKIGVKPSGGLITGGTPIVTVAAAGGTAVSGKDYTLGGTVLSFPAGSSATQYADLTVFDDGTVNDSKTLKLAFTLNPMGTSATINAAFDTLSININNNDSIPSLVSTVPIETNLSATRTWNIPAGEEVYFYNPTNKNLIAGIKNTSNDLGCVQATITQSGNGMKPSLFSPGNRSLKEVTITPTINGSTTTYDVIVYMSNTDCGKSAFFTTAAEDRRSE